MRVKLQCQVNEIEGKILSNNYIEEDLDDPIFLNMQFCIERKQYAKLKELCSEYKLTSLHSAINTMLNETDPQRIVDFLSE